MSSEDQEESATLPRGWLKATLVERYSVHTDATTKVERLTTEAIDQGGLFMYLVKKKYPELTSRQYRQALRILCGEKAAGRTRPLRADLRALLMARMVELGRKAWGCSRASKVLLQSRPKGEEGKDSSSSTKPKKKLKSRLKTKTIKTEVTEVEQTKNDETSSSSSSSASLRRTGSKSQKRAISNKRSFDSLEHVDTSRGTGTGAAAVAAVAAAVNAAAVQQGQLAGPLTMLQGSADRLANALSEDGEGKVSYLPAQALTAQAMAAMTNPLEHNSIDARILLDLLQERDLDGINVNTVNKLRRLESSALGQRIAAAEAAADQDTQLRKSYIGQPKWFSPSNGFQQHHLLDRDLSSSSSASTSSSPITVPLTADSSASASSSPATALLLTNSPTSAALVAPSAVIAAASATRTKKSATASTSLAGMSAATSATHTGMSAAASATYASMSAGTVLSRAPQPKPSQDIQREYGLSLNDVFSNNPEWSSESTPLATTTSTQGGSGATTTYETLEKFYLSCFSDPTRVGFTLIGLDHKGHKLKLPLFVNQFAVNHGGAEVANGNYEPLDDTALAQLTITVSVSSSEERIVCVPGVWFNVNDEYGNAARRLVDMWVDKVKVPSQQGYIVPYMFSPHGTVKLVRQPSAERLVFDGVESQMTQWSQVRW